MLRLSSAALVALLPVAASAADLRIGLAVPPTAIDPHFHNNGQNNSNSSHIFEGLTRQDEAQRIKPALAESWRTTDDRTWEFKLRPGVVFHDGSPFTAEDVAFTLKRAPDVPRSPSSFAGYLKAVADYEVVDPHTIRIRTKGPDPLLPVNLSKVWIVSAKVGRDATTADYNSGKAMIGTGPYAFAEWATGERLTLKRNERYWGEREPWDKVDLRIIPAPAARVAALLAGDVDLIADVPSTNRADLERNQAVKVWSGASNRVVFLSMDVASEMPLPGVEAKDGTALAKNPLRDLRVRAALSKAIDRKAIVERVLEGDGLPADQLLPAGLFGRSPNLALETPDLEAAKQLLKDAGYPDGFKLPLYTSHDRVANAVNVVQTVAQWWTRLGLQVKVETMPHTIYLTRAGKTELSAMLHSWGAGTGEASDTLGALVHTVIPTAGFGASNRGRYSNPEVDKLIDQALVTVDDAKREVLLIAATDVAIKDHAVLPLYFSTNVWATRKDLVYKVRADSNTLAMGVRAK